MTRGLFALDIDGVLTDGTVSMNVEGDETKRLSYRDIDAVFRAKREGLTVALLTAEDTPVAAAIGARLQVDNFIAGRRDKGAALRELADRLSVPRDAICYIGDSVKDVEALELAGLGLVPADAEEVARNVADTVLTRKGGQGAVAEGLALFLARLERGAAAPLLEEPRQGGGDRQCASEAIRSLISLLEEFEASAHEDILAAVWLLRETLEDGGTIYTFGNGRSAMAAQHFAAEVVGFSTGSPGVGRAVALTSDAALIAAMANDAGYRDAAVAFTMAGMPENVRRGLESARNEGVGTVIVTGANAPPGIDADVKITVPSTNPQRIQEAHTLVVHLLCGLLGDHA